MSIPGSSRPPQGQKLQEGTGKSSRCRWAGDASPWTHPRFSDLMIEMEDQTNDVHEAGIPTLDYKTYTDRVFFLPSKDGDKDVMITGKLDIPESRRPIVEQALYQFSNLLNSKSFLINVSIRKRGQGCILGSDEALQ